MREVGDAGMRGVGDVGMRGVGDAGMRGVGDAGTRGVGDAEKLSNILSVFSFPRVPVSPRPRVPASPHRSIYRLATRINKNIPIPKKTKLGNQAPIKGERTPAWAIAPLIKKIK